MHAFFLNKSWGIKIIVAFKTLEFLHFTQEKSNSQDFGTYKSNINFRSFPWTWSKFAVFYLYYCCNPFS